MVEQGWVTLGEERQGGGVWVRAGYGPDVRAGTKQGRVTWERGAWRMTGRGNGGWKECNGAVT
eukprot:2659296-Rhodomonas_salina.1